MADFLRSFGDEQFLRDAEYLSLAEMLGTVIWTADPGFKKRVASLSKLSIFDGAIRRIDKRVSPFKTISDDMVDSSTGLWDLRVLSDRIRVVTDEMIP